MLRIDRRDDTRYCNLVCSKLVRLQELERCAVAIGLSMLVQVLVFLVVRFRILLNSSEIDLPLWK